MRYTPWVVSEHVPDFSSLEALLKGPRFAGKKDEELAVALWQLMVDRELGIFHYFPAQERFWGKDVFDPLKVFNVYGFAICHIHAHVLAMLFKAAGMPARIAAIRGHEGTEAFYDGGWHYFDADVQMFHRLRPPRERTIASREDLYRDPTLVSHQPTPSNPYHMPDRLPQHFCELYKSPPEYPDLLEERIHSMDFRLRPGEEMTRYFHNRGRWVVFESYPEAFARWPGETGPEGPTERFWPRRQWGNGYFLYEPKLQPGWRDLEEGAEEIAGLSLLAGGLACTGGIPARRDLQAVGQGQDAPDTHGRDARATGHVVFAFESPYIYCGVPDPMRRAPSVDGAVLSADFELPTGGSARVEAATDQSEQWQTLWSSGSAVGTVPCRVDFTPLAEGRYRFRLRVVLEGRGSAMKSFKTKLWFMVSPHSLPALRNAGDNRMSVHGGDRFGLNTRTILVEHRADEPQFVSRLAGAVNLSHDPSSNAILRRADPSGPWEAVFELAAPEGGKLVWVSAYAVIEGRKPGEDYDGAPATIELADSPDGPWRTVASREIVPHAHGWHFGLFGEGRFSGHSGKGYVRFSAKKGAKGFRLAGHYAQAGADAGPGLSCVHSTHATALVIEHAWYEDDPRVGRRLRTHVEKVAGDRHEYVVRCAAQPHDERITLRVPSTGAAG